MKIKCSKKRSSFNLFLGVPFVIFGTLKAYEGTADFVHYIQIILGVLMVISFFIERKFGYLSIEDGMLTKYSFSCTTIDLDKITNIQSRPGRIKLITSKKNLSINPSVIDKDSIKNLYRVLGSLQLESQKNPFTGWSAANS
ncbi:hypothetical protein [Salinimicrobium sp. TH3]|uniref:hypothetical protein n=1 Tax=Salinimicrobium sp. TH3 TaxID=2997342 RepID=UPI002272CC01|nr:hypothetical protein [Salinimicrobium sp. TH3]MCY2686886.1 hypothetical protein [Salinimicrobium sp. TH3]